MATRQKVGLFVEAYGIQRMNRELLDLVKQVKPDVAIVQNVFPLMSPSVYSTLFSANIPIIQAVYNYRLVCPSAELYTEGAICERCVSGNTAHAIIHRCYRNSYAQSAWYASIIGFHRMIGTFNKKISYFMVPDEFLGKKLIAGGIQGEKIRWNPNPYFTSPIKPEATHKGHVLFVGRLIRQKGILTLLKAMTIAGPNSRLVIVGQGELSVQIQNEISRAGLEGRITLMGPLWDDEMICQIQNSAAVVIPSEWYDNLPLILCQANAAGKPVIASRINGIPEYVREGENGFMFETGNAIELAGLIDKVLGLSQEEYSLLSKRSRSFAENVFDYPNHYRILMEIIRQAKEDK